MILDKLNSFLKSEPAQMDIYGHTTEFMIILERTTSTAFYAHLISSLKKT